MTRSTQPPPAFHEIPLERLGRTGVVRAVAGELEILAVMTPDGVRVYSGLCPHLGGPLLEGAVRRGVLRCPWHGYTFDLASGRCLTAPGGPWRSLPGGGPESDEPLEIELAELPFDQLPDRVRVHLGAAPSDDPGDS